jgi:hypothetical protein
VTQVSLFPNGQDESLAALDQLFQETRTYKRSREYLALLRFIKRFPTYAPFNCLLLHTQNPGVRYVATPEQWRKRFRRRVKPDTRPLVILAPMSPVLFVYDVTDTEGEPVPPELLDPFAVGGTLSEGIWKRTLGNCPRDLIAVFEQEFHPNLAGKIGPAVEGDVVDVLIGKETNGQPIYERRKARFRLAVNKKQELAARYVTLVHELAHLYCGHIGTPDEDWWPNRQHVGRDVREFEAESVAYLVAARLGIRNPSASYLSGYLRGNREVPDISIDRVLKVAGLIEKMGRERLKPRKEKS